MISTLGIKNFKSIASLQLDCRRINVLIGRPNVGKSNILESLGLLSYGFYGSSDDGSSVFDDGNDAGSFLRFESSSNLFRDDNIEDPVEVSWDDTALVFRYENGNYDGRIQSRNDRSKVFSGDHRLIEARGSNRTTTLAPFKMYRFADMGRYNNLDSEFLAPPSGDNLLSLLLTHKELRSLANSLFSTIGLRLGLRPNEH